MFAEAQRSSRARRRSIDRSVASGRELSRPGGLVRMRFTSGALVNFVSAKRETSRCNRAAPRDRFLGEIPRSCIYFSATRNSSRITQPTLATLSADPRGLSHGRTVALHDLCRFVQRRIYRESIVRHYDHASGEQGFSCRVFCRDQVVILFTTEQILRRYPFVGKQNLNLRRMNCRHTLRRQFRVAITTADSFVNEISLARSHLDRCIYK